MNLGLCRHNWGWVIEPKIALERPVEEDAILIKSQVIKNFEH